MSTPTTFAVRETNSKSALLFIHGFSGDSYLTFGMLPAFVAGDQHLTLWDIHCIGYPTSLRPDVTGVWSADPDLGALAGFLATSIRAGRFEKYSTIAIVAHSMGGLVVQRAILDGGFVDRLHSVALFGTPSNGLAKAWLVSLFKQQARDMARGGRFIRALREDWTSRYGTSIPFVFRTVAGTQDEFVPTSSSIDPFPSECHWYVRGNHLEIVKPVRRDDDTPILIRNLLTPQSSSASPVASAHKEKIDRFGLSSEILTRSQIIELVFALEMTGNQTEAIRLLEARRSADTELTGLLAGRFKRRWLADPDDRADEGTRSLSLYREAYEQASNALDHPQAFYNGINCAFMEVALCRSWPAAREIAAHVLEHVKHARVDRWSLATEGEAQLYLGDVKAAIDCYAQARQQTHSPREHESMMRQAVWITRLSDRQDVEERLKAVFALDV